MSGQTAYGNKPTDAGSRRTWDKEGKLSISAVFVRYTHDRFRICGKSQGEGSGGEGDHATEGGADTERYTGDLSTLSHLYLDRKEASCQS